MANALTLQPISYFAGSINLPGSKSISNRALLLAAFANGTTEITNLLDSDDVHYMLQALAELGVKYQLSEDKTRCIIEGVAGPLTQSLIIDKASADKTLYLGNAGTAMRPLTAALCLGNSLANIESEQSRTIILTGEPRMKERPIGHLVDALIQGGAIIEYLEAEHYPPLAIKGGFVGGQISVDGSISSQFLTALLMTVPLAPNDSTISIIGDLVSKPYIDITLQMMKRFGVEVTHQDYKIFNVKGAQQYQSPGRFLVEGDASSASYFLAAAAIRGGKVRVTGIGKSSMQGDIHFATALEKMGAKITWNEEYIECERGELNGIDMDMNHIPDAAMTIATTALFAKGITRMTNIYNWRVKETDRLSAMATELRKVGAEVTEGEDFIQVTPPQTLKHAEIETYNDHRMAMCFSLVALSDTPVTILDPKCTSKTFPTYFTEFTRMAGDLNDAPVITVDGPSGVGKGTLSNALAKYFGWNLLDSGAIYRVLALSALKQQVDLANEIQLVAVAKTLNIVFRGTESGVDVLLDDENISKELRLESTGKVASQIAAYPKVRDALLERQKAFQTPPGLIADGRDMGTVVFPNAKAKIFLDASPQARAERRITQLQKQGAEFDESVILQEIIERDKRDRERVVAPLIPAKDALLIDTTNLTIDEVIQRAIEFVENR